MLALDWLDVMDDLEESEAWCRRVGIRSVEPRGLLRAWASLGSIGVVDELLSEPARGSLGRIRGRCCWLAPDRAIRSAYTSVEGRGGPRDESLRTDGDDGEVDIGDSPAAGRIEDRDPCDSGARDDTLGGDGRLPVAE